MAATERIPLLVTPAQKALITKRAKASKLTVNEFVRRAAEVYNPRDEVEALMRLVAQVKQTTHEATTALDARSDPALTPIDGLRIRRPPTRRGVLRGRKCSRQSQWCVGFEGHTDAGIGHF